MTEHLTAAAKERLARPIDWEFVVFFYLTVIVLVVAASIGIDIANHPERAAKHKKTLTLILVFALVAFIVETVYLFVKLK